MGKLRNQRQEAFVRHYIALGGEKFGAEAYRRAYPTCNPTEGAKRSAWLLLNRVPHVKKRYEELRQQMARRADITEDKILGDYQHALDLAKEQEKPADIVNAATAQAKLVGLLRDRVEAGNVGDFDNLENVSDVIEAVQELVGPEAALALANAFKIAQQPSNEQPEASETGLAIAKPASDAVN